ncbi:phospholipase A-2-activating protein [Epithele typhae]|uniref:phospholipase A-2-activating protein n=1 Tax=Epithele typhae TaxID=378194 RepID=UPI0020080E79|nr:phospholipase A-2-activating protein [Epithele typhae]KAH9945813.1 phospholipase A-2-activating protein [Epithele typhae]
MSYRLSATLDAHTADVKAVVSPTDDLILSASRDTTAIAWARVAQSITQTTILRPGSRYINAVAYLPPAPGAPEGYAATGGQDTVINIFALPAPKGEPSFSLIGHSENVCALHVAQDGTIISGSWDKTAKVWKDFKLLYDLVGHQQSVWAVVAIDSGQFLTAVRGLALIADIGFASCSNDSEIRVWTMEGDTVYTLSGHTSFVYSLSVLPNGDIVSGGEDHSARVWRDGECVQTLVLPAISVWSVSTMPNGDIVTGSSDGIVRVFSTEESRWAPADQLQAYDDMVAAQALPSQAIGDVKKSDLPGPEALSQPGNKPGEVKMIRRGESVEAHQWDSANASWQKIGDVVDAVGPGRKQLYEGKEYDYVFDVDVKEGVPPLKLPYNVSDNPYSAAQRFLQTNELPLSYLDEVVRFIEKNTAGVNVGTSNDEFVDPYTGASRYQASQTTSSGPSEFMDPFTGASRYRAAPPVASSTPASSGGDPWTGASRYSSGVTSPAPASPQPVASSSAPVIPVQKPISFRQGHVTAMQSKLYQFDQGLKNEISTSSLGMYPDELKLVEEMFSYLSASMAKTSTQSLNSSHVEALISILERWPQAPLFPLMDLSRLVVAHAPSAYADSAVRARFFAALFHGASWAEPWSSPLPKSRETNMLFLFRALANAIQENATAGDGKWLEEIIDKVGDAPYTVLTNNLRVSLATVMFNITCLGLREPLPPTLRDASANLVLGILQAEKTEPEAAYRALVAFGNVAHAARTYSCPLAPAQAADARQTLAALPGTFSDARVRDVSSEVAALL